MGHKPRRGWGRQLGLLSNCMRAEPAWVGTGDPLIVMAALDDRSGHSDFEAHPAIGLQAIALWLGLRGAVAGRNPVPSDPDSYFRPN